MRILFVGDIYGDPGLSIFKEELSTLKSKYRPEVIIVNGENVTNGRGLSKTHYLELMKSGVHAITMGNWTYANNELLTYIDDSKVIRPANYLEAPGAGYKVININGKRILVVNLLGRVFMNVMLENPFHVMTDILNKTEYDYVFVDFHAEATSEKMAFAHYFDGKVDAVVGTHTHVQTNDSRMLPNKTLYITDVGMTGALDGIIGVAKDIVIPRFLTGYQKQANIVAKGKRQLNAVFLDLTNKTIEKIHIEK